MFNLKHYTHDDEYCFSLFEGYRFEFLSTEIGLTITQVYQNVEILTIYTDEKVSTYKTENIQ